MILYGGELAFAFLAVRIARWMWRSREHVLALWRERNGAPPSGPSFEPDGVPEPAPPRAAVVALTPRSLRSAETTRRAA
jgi:hypothetical protein